MPSTRIRRSLTAALSLVGVAAAMLGAQVAATALQETDRSPQGLVERLATLERELPVLPPGDVILIDGETWAEFPGDFTGARFELDNLTDRARALFIDAEDADGPVPEAVADAARGILIQREGYARLAAWEEHDLAFPLDAVDESGVATGADEPYGLAQTGLRLLLDANERRLAAHELLRDSEVPDDQQRQLFARAYDATRDFEGRVRPLIHRALSLPTTEVLRPVERFTTSAPGTQARARTFRVVCLDREAHLSEPSLVDLPEELAALGQIPAVDCPELDNPNEVRPVG